MTPKIKTYRFKFRPDGSQNDDEVEFCARTWEDADKLFDRFCEDEHIKINGAYTIDVVYNKDDHETYGDNYSWGSEDL